MFGYYDTKNIPNSLKKSLNLDKNIDLISIFDSIVKKYNQNNIEYIILGCTELPLFVNKNNIQYDNIKFIDTTQLLVDNILN